MEVHYSTRFTRSYQALPQHIQKDFDEQIARFIKNPRDPQLRTHKLKGKLVGCLAFVLRDGCRVLFQFISRNVVRLTSIGPHDHYRRWK